MIWYGRFPFRDRWQSRLVGSRTLKSQTGEDLSPKTSVGDYLIESTLEVQLRWFREVLLKALSVIDSWEAIVQVRDDDTINLKDKVGRFEAEVIRVALLRTGGNQKEAARLLGVKETTLSFKIRRYQLSVSMQF